MVRVRVFGFPRERFTHTDDSLIAIQPGKKLISIQSPNFACAQNKNH
jgi:hypothetical protein